MSRLIVTVTPYWRTSMGDYVTGTPVAWRTPLGRDGQPLDFGQLDRAYVLSSQPPISLTPEHSGEVMFQVTVRPEQDDVVAEDPR